MMKHKRKNYQTPHPRSKEKVNDQDEKTSFFSHFEISPDAAHGVIVILCFLIGLISLFSLLGLASEAGQTIEYWLGRLFGWSRFLFPFLMIGLGVIVFTPQLFPIRIFHGIGVVFFLLSLTGLFEIFYPAALQAEGRNVGDGGGIIGTILANPLRSSIGSISGFVILVGLFLISTLLILNTSLRKIIPTSEGIQNIFRFLAWKGRLFGRKEEDDFESSDAPNDDLRVESLPMNELKEQGALFLEKNLPEHGGRKTHRIIRKYHRIEIPLDLLDSASSKPKSGDIELNKATIQHTLKNFGIDVEMGAVSVGPTVTQYTFRPSEGVKLSQITTLQNDLALALAAHPIRIEAPIPGKALVGVEVPNKSVAIVRLRDSLESKAFRNFGSRFTFVLGSDVSGSTVCADLETMPHLLIAGATGSGKSVMIHSLIMSLLMQNGPDDLKLILIDPKRVELTLYNGISHLLTPVITDPKKTIRALRWTVTEMDRRYGLLSAAGKKNIATYNERIDERLPYLVIIIDELADLMAVAAKDVESVIIRLAQMARAVGIHLVVATQRPSVDVITGLIKANITSRIAFTVASIVDSRTILDHSSAEKLLGRGDMLFISSELSKPRRIQGAYVDEKEVNRIVQFLKNHGPSTNYNDEILEKSVSSPVGFTPGDDGSDEDEELIQRAQEIIVQAGKASASFLQRRLRLGYARAARILDILEERGIIGPSEGAKPREVYLSGGGDQQSQSQEFPPDHSESPKDK